MVLMLQVICILKFNNLTCTGIFNKTCLLYRPPSDLPLARKWQYKSKGIRSTIDQPLINDCKCNFFFLLNFLDFSKFNMNFTFFITLMRLIFPWTKFRGFCGFLANPQKFVSAKFVLFFYPPKSNHAKIFSNLFCGTGSAFFKKVLLFNNLN